MSLTIDHRLASSDNDGMSKNFPLFWGPVAADLTREESIMQVARTNSDPAVAHMIWLSKFAGQN